MTLPRKALKFSLDENLEQINHVALLCKILYDSEKTLMLFIFAAQTTQQREQTIICT